MAISKTMILESTVPYFGRLHNISSIININQHYYLLGLLVEHNEI